MKEHSYCKKVTTTIPEEIIYADDADFLTSNIERKEKINEIIKYMLLEDNLKVKESKTEYTTLVRENVKKENIKTNTERNQ